MDQQLVTPEFWAGRRVLLTGHTGFKGSWLALWLSELGAHVTGLGLEPDSDPHLFDQLQLERRLRQHHIADIRDPQALVDIAAACQPEVVLHLAAQPLVRRSYRDPLGTWATNVQGTLNLLEALKPLRRPCAVVMVTTDKVYANQEWDYGYREDDRLGGHDPYSASKAAAELAIASWRFSFCGEAPHQTPSRHRHGPGRQRDRRRRLGRRSNSSRCDAGTGCRPADPSAQSSCHAPLAACARAAMGLSEAG